jgi:hypothetical protein
MAAGHCYIASEWRTQKTQLPTVTPLLLVTEPSPSNGWFFGSTVVATRKYEYANSYMWLNYDINIYLIKITSVRSIIRAVNIYVQ